VQPASLGGQRGELSRGAWAPGHSLEPPLEPSTSHTYGVDIATAAKLELHGRAVWGLTRYVLLDVGRTFCGGVSVDAGRPASTALQ